MKNLIVRPARRTDQTRIIGLWRDSVYQDYHFMDRAVQERWIEDGPAEEYIRERLSGCHVAESDGLVIGFVVVIDDLIDLLWIDKGYRRQGVARRLLDWAEAEIGRRHDRAELYCYVPNQTALALYQKRGYTDRGRVRDETSGEMKYRLIKDLATVRAGSA